MKRIIPYRKSSVAIKVLRLFGMNIRSDEPLKGHRDDPAHTSDQPVTFNVQAYMLGTRRMHEIEAEKAMVILGSRHDRWKAGGPL